MPTRPGCALRTGNSSTTPAVVIRPIFWFPASVNQKLPSGPTVRMFAALPAPVGNSVITPSGVTRTSSCAPKARTTCSRPARA